MNNYIKQLVQQQKEINAYFKNQEKLKEDRIKESIIEDIYQEKLLYKKFYNLKNSFNSGIKDLNDLSENYLNMNLSQKKEFYKNFSIAFIDYCIKNNHYSFSNKYLINTFHNSLKNKDNERKRLYLTKKIKDYLLKNSYVVNIVYTIDRPIINRQEKLKTCDNESYQFLMSKFNKYKNFDIKKASCLCINSLSWKLRHSYKKVNGFNIIKDNNNNIYLKN